MGSATLQPNHGQAVQPCPGGTGRPAVRTCSAAAACGLRVTAAVSGDRTSSAAAAGVSYGATAGASVSVAASATAAAGQAAGQAAGRGHPAHSRPCTPGDPEPGPANLARNAHGHHTWFFNRIVFGGRRRGHCPPRQPERSDAAGCVGTAP